MSAMINDEDFANLTWARKVNDESRVGLFGPTVRRRGFIPECERLVSEGLFTRRDPPISKDEWGYWITDYGRDILRTHKQAGR